MKRLKHPLYLTWQNMVARCKNAKNDNYGRYGARGIKVCERWLVFENFVADMSPRPEGYTLDRIDNNKGYSPENCKWATQSTQCRNTERNVFIEYKGRRQVLTDWSRELGISAERIRQRMRRGKSFEESITMHRMARADSKTGAWAIQKFGPSYAVRFKKNGKRYYKGGFKSIGAAIAARDEILREIDL